MPRANRTLKVLEERLEMALERKRRADAEIELVEDLIRVCHQQPKKKAPKTATPIQTVKVQ